ncbi:MAG: cell division protein FtsK [Anaerolineae bacterium]|nr:cell division protein FtsK [Anaerolineae bacterium]
MPSPTTPGGSVPGGRPSVSPSGSQPGSPTPGVGPGAASGRTFGPGLPGALGGSGSPAAPPKPNLPRPGLPTTQEETKSGLVNAQTASLIAVKEPIETDDPLPPSEQIIKELIEEEEKGTPSRPAQDIKVFPPVDAKDASNGAKDGERKSEDDVATVKSSSTLSSSPRPAALPSQPPAAVKPAPMAPPKIESLKEEKPPWEVPPIDILEVSAEKSISDEELRQRAMVIEQTLSSFGAPGRVVEVNHGPVITQFGVEPDYIDGRAGKRIKVKVGKISALSDDLALSLAAPSIRIEAPVPGKGYVGIEVPNAEPSIVGLRDAMDTPEFRNLKSLLKMALGQDVSGQPIVADMTAMPHLLIAGTTGSGKSVCVNGIICAMLMTCSPDELKMIMVDPKRVELTNYNGIPHLMAPVVTELERIVGVLKWVQREMDERYRRFAMEGARNIMDFNGRIERGQIKDAEKIPYILVVVDELADLMMLAPDETERVITRLAQMARATGIHIIISTQRPSVDVVTGLIKANFPARIAFAVATGVDSRVILDMPGAEKLLGRGDMLFQAPDAPMPIRMQGVYLSDREIQKIVDHWRAQATKRGHVQPVLNLGPVSGGFSSGSTPTSSPVVQQRPLFESDDDNGNGDNADDLFNEAVELVRGMEKASISLLQRHLRIGYTRAARLIDLMEEQGVIGPHEGGSKPRVVLGPDGEPLRDFDDEEDENA